MTRRRELMHMAGWTAVVGGLAALAGAILVESAAVDMLGSYGMLVALAGGWIVVGLKVLSRREEAIAERSSAARGMTQRSVNLG